MERDSKQSFAAAGVFILLVMRNLIKREITLII